jgi:tRNA threonylcarbamoyl adenosine modification protein YeaZ
VTILAIETSMGRTSAALSIGPRGETVLVKRLPGGTAQAEQLIPLIAGLMAEAGQSFSSLGRVAVSIGPGGFSGIRAGVAAARGIGLAGNICVVGATSFRIMAAEFEKRAQAATYALAAPAGQAAIFCQLWRAGCIPATGVAVLSREDAAAFFENAEVMSGPAAQPLAEGGFVSMPVLIPDLVPDAATLAELAPALDPKSDAPVPYYARPADARPQDRHVIARRAG